MKTLNCRTAVKSAAGLGLFALLASAPCGRAAAQNNQLIGSQPTVEPQNDDAVGGPPATEGTEASQNADSVIRKWPEGSRAAARAMIGKYGEPTRISEGSLVWIGNGPWAKTVVYRNAWPHFVGKRDKDYLEQTVAYRVPDDKVNDLKRFDRRLEVNQDKGELSSRSENEALNTLALNLADEIVTDKRTVEDARDFYSKTERLSMAGKSSQYTDGLLFSPRADANRPVDRIDPDYDKNMTP